MQSTTNAGDLVQRFNALNEDLLNFVQTCDSADWTKVTEAEGWQVGVTARHIAVAHYPVIEWVQMIVQGDVLPPVTMQTIDQINAQHAAEHQRCTKEEVVDLLRTNHAKVIAYLETLGDEDLARQGYLTLFDADVSASTLFTAVLIDATAAHLESMKAATKSDVNPLHV